MKNTLKEPAPSGSFGAMLMGKRINSTNSGTKVQDPLRNHHNTNAAFCSKRRTSSVIISTPKPPHLNPELYNNLVKRFVSPPKPPHLNPELYNNLVKQFVPPSPLANTPLTGVKVNIKSKHKHELLWLNPTAQENEPTRTKSSLCMGVKISPIVIHSSKNTREVKPTKNNLQVSLKQNDVQEPVALLCVDCLSIKKEPMRVKFQSHEYVPLEVVGEQLKKECAPGVAKSDLRLERVYDVLTPNSPEPVAPAPAKTPRLPATKKSEKRIYHQGLSPSGASYAVCSHAPVKVRDKKVPPTLTLFHVHRIQFDPKVTNRRYVDVATLFDAFLTTPIDTLSISEITSSRKPKRKTNKRSKQLSHIILAKKPLTTPSRDSNTSENPNKDKNKQTENPAAKNPDNLFKFPDGTFYCEKMLEKLVRMKRLAELTAKQRSATTPRKKQGRHYLEDLIQKNRAQDSDTHAPNVTLQNVADPALTKRICAENDNPKEQTSSSKKTSAARKRSSKQQTIINTKAETDEFQFESLIARHMEDTVICQTDGSTLYNTLSYADKTLSTASTAVSPIPSQTSTEQKLKPSINITPGDQTIDSISASDSRFEKPCDVSLSQYELQAEIEASCNDSCSQGESMMYDGDSTSRTRHVTSPANHVIRIPHLPLDDNDTDYWSMSNCKVNDNHIPSLNVTSDYQNHSHEEINTYRAPLQIETNDHQNLPLNEVNDYGKPSHIEIKDHQIPSHNEINDHQNQLRNEINDHQSLSCNADHKSATPYLASHSLCLSRSSRSLRTQEPTSTIVSSCLVSDITSPRHQTCLEKNAMSHHLPHICSKTSSSRLISSSNEFSACVNNANLMTGEVMSNLLRHSLVNSSVHSPSGWASTSLHPPSTLVNSSLHTTPGLVRQGHVKPNKKQIQTSESSKSLPQRQNSTLINGKSLPRFHSVEMKDSMSEKSFDHAENKEANEAESMRDAFGSTHDSVERVSSLLDCCDANSVRSQEVRSSVVKCGCGSLSSRRMVDDVSSVMKCGCGSLSSRRLVDDVSTVLDDGVTADTLTEADVTTDVGGEDVETLAEVDVTVLEGGASMVTLAETDVTFKDGCIAVDTLREVGVPTEDDEASAVLIAEVDVMKERNELTGSTLELNGLAGSQVSELTRSEVPRSGLPGSGLSRSGLSCSGLSKSGLSGSGLSKSGLSGSGLSKSGLSGSGLDHKQDQQLLTDETHYKQKSETPIHDIESTQRSTTFSVNEQHTEEKQPPLGIGYTEELTLNSDVINEQPVASDDKLKASSQNPHELSLPPPRPDHHLIHPDPTQPDPTHPNRTQPEITSSYMSCSQTSQRSGQNVSICSSRDETCSPDPPDHHHHHNRAPTPHGIISTEASQTNLYDNYSLSQIDLNRKNITFSSDMNNFVSEEFLEYLNSLPSRGISKCNLQIPSVYAKLDRREYPPGPVRRLEPLGCGDGLLERSSSNRTCLVAYHPLLPARVASPGHQSISITGRTVIPDIRGASQTRTRHQDVQYSICGRCRTGGVQHHGIVPQYLASSYSTSPHCTSHYRAL